MKYVGVDVAKVKAVCCIVNPDGSIAEETSYPNTSHDAARFARQVTGEHGEFEAVLESTGNLWVKTYEAFESNGIRVKLANPVKTRAIAEARVKTDKLDAKILAHLLRADLIAECYVPPRDIRESRSLLSHRANIVKEQTVIKNRVHSLLDKYDLRCEYGNIFGTHGMKWLHTLQLQLSGHDQGTLESLLRQLEFLQGEEETANSRIACDALNSRYVQVIMSMTGFDYCGASLLTAYIGDISRFPSPGCLVSWAGLCPSVHQTGDSLHLGKMKDGNRKVRWILVQAANVAIRCDPRMRAFYEKKTRRHNHNVAMTHVATKMLKILWHMLREDKLYNERNERRYTSKLKRMANKAN